MGLLTESDSELVDTQANSVTASLERLDDALERVIGIQTLAPDGLEVQEAAYEMAGIIDDLALTRDAMSSAKETEDELWVILKRDTASPDRVSDGTVCLEGGSGL